MPVPVDFRDYHVHLQDFDRANLPRVMEKSRQAGVSLFDCCSTGPADWRAVSDISERYPGVIPGFGVHPWNVALAESNFPDWEKGLREKLCCIPGSFVGEIGLDSYHGELELQRTVFRKQLAAASEFGRRVNVHCCGAYGELFDIISEYADRLAGIVLHSPSMSFELARRFVGLGAMFSFGRRAFFANSVKSRILICKLPADRLCFESDSPSGSDSGPWDVPRLYYEAMKLRGYDVFSGPGVEES